MSMLKPARKVAAPTPEDVRTRLAELQSKAKSLLREQMDLAEKSINDDAAERDYKANIAEGVEVDGEIKRLEAALASMDIKAAAQATAEQAAASASARATVEGLLNERILAGEAFQVAIGEAIKHLRAIAALNRRANLAWPGVSPDVMATALSDGSLQRFVSNELFRQNDIPVVTGGASAEPGRIGLPGAVAPSYEFASNPGAAPSFVEQMTGANAVAKGLLAGKRS